MQSQPYTRTADRRDDSITLIALYHFLMSLLFLAATVILAIPTVILAIVAVTEAPPAAIGLAAVGLIAGVTMTFTLLFLAVGYGLWTLRQWGKIAAMALAVLSLPAFPVGTVIGGLILWRLLDPAVAARFEDPV